MKYKITEWYIDCMNASGENDEVVRSETIEADSEREAQELYEARHSVGMNNSLRVRALG
jgi:hypothetical protein